MDERFSMVNSNEYAITKRIRELGMKKKTAIIKWKKVIIKPYIILLLIILLVIAGCKPTIPSVIMNTSCLPPCWNGIEPGHTTQEEALSILKSLKEVKQNSIKIWSIVKENDCIRWMFVSGSGEKYGDMFINNDLVFGFGFSPENNGLTLETAIKYLGEPDSIIAIYHQQEIRYISVFINYKSKGVVLWTSINPYDSTKQAMITNDMHVEGFWYIEPDLYTKLMSSNYIAGINPAILENNTHPWQGYGDITPILVELDY